MRVVLPLSMWAEMPMLRTLPSAARSSAVTPAGCAAAAYRRSQPIWHPLMLLLGECIRDAAADEVVELLLQGPAAMPAAITGVSPAAALAAIHPRARKPCWLLHITAGKGLRPNALPAACTAPLPAWGQPRWVR